MDAMPPVAAPARPSQLSDPAQALTRPLLVSMCLAVTAVAAAALILATAVAVVGWFLGDGSGSAAQAARAGALLWLTAHGGAPVVGGVPITLVPLAAPLLVGLALVSAGRWAVATSAPVVPVGSAPVVLRYAGVVAGGAGCYAAVVALVGWAVWLSAAPGAVQADTVRGIALTGVGATAALAIGVGSVGGRWRDLVDRAPVEMVAVARGAAAGVVALLAAGALVLMALLAVRADRVLAVGAELRPGTVGGFWLALLCAATLPNAVLWSTSYLVGPGFAVGTATVVAPDGVVLGPLPAYPLLGALPAPGTAPPWVSALTVLPVLAGVLAGAAAARWLGTGGWWRLALVGAGAGAGSGLLLAALMLLSGGGVGPQRMQDTGPLLASAVVCVLTLTVAAAAGAVAAEAMHGFQLPRLPGWLPHRLSDRLPDRLRDWLPDWLHRTR